MIRRITILALTVALVSTTFVFTGCQTTSAQPNSLTGMTDAQRWHYTDDKGRFHSDLAKQGRPLR